MTVAKGQVWRWRRRTYTITRVARDASWADVELVGGITPGGWRQPLPFGKGWERVPS